MMVPGYIELLILAFFGLAAVGVVAAVAAIIMLSANKQKEK